MHIEGASGAVDKIAPLVKFPVLMRIALPGGIAVLWLYPLARWSSNLFLGSRHEEWEIMIFVLSMIGVFGAMASLLRGVTYQIYEGRALWPEWLLTRRLECHKTRVDNLLAEAEAEAKAKAKAKAKAEAKAKAVAEEKCIHSHSFRYSKLWYQLRAYPFDSSGKPYALHPTLLGNILASYEKYPLTRYGMDSVFYWPRLWVQLERETKEEIDAKWSPADGLVSSSSVAYAGGLIWLLAAVLGARVLKSAHLTLPFQSSTLTALAGLGFLVLGFCFYYLSLGFHRANGEAFKSLFDLYRERLTAMGVVGPEEKEYWRTSWAYLQYLEVQCTECKKFVANGVEYCEECKKHRAKPVEKKAA
jgi:hypothetical protein